MNHSKSNQARGEERAMIQYWLGELSPEAERRLEERYFADDDLFEQLLAVREELFDAYARGELSEAERARFEQHLLHSPENREELEFARRFAGALDHEIAEDDTAPEPAE
jgi:anti-sigma factor RsiW